MVAYSGFRRDHANTQIVKSYGFASATDDDTSWPPMTSVVISTTGMPTVPHGFTIYASSENFYHRHDLPMVDKTKRSGNTRYVPFYRRLIGRPGAPKPPQPRIRSQHHQRNERRSLRQSLHSRTRGN